jgi:hypothetical protein
VLFDVDFLHNKRSLLDARSKKIPFASVATATQIILATLPLYSQNATWRSSTANTELMLSLFVILLNYHDVCDVLLIHVINANKMIHNELVLLVCFSTVDDMNLLIWSNPIHYNKSNILITLLVYQYCTKFWKKITILEQIFIPVLWSPSTGDPLSLCLNHKYLKSVLQKYILK